MSLVKQRCRVQFYIALPVMPPEISAQHGLRIVCLCSCAERTQLLDFSRDHI